MMSSMDNDGLESARDGEQSPYVARSAHGPAATAGRWRTPSPELFHPPRLGIIHLLAWIGVSAVLLKVMAGAGWFGHFPDHFSRWIRIFFTTNGVIQMAKIAAGVVGISVILRARHRGIGGRLQAGHWIVINTTVTACLSLILVLAITMMEYWLKTLSSRIYPSTYQIVLFSSMAAWQFILAALWVVVAIRAREPAYWKAVFVFLSVCSIANGFMYFPIAFFSSLASLFRLPISASLTLIIIPVVVLVDSARRMKRDWIHWLGIAIIVLTSISSVMQFVALSFINTP